MSLAAVMMAARNKLQTVFGLDADSCEIGFGPEPKPAAGEFYIAVHSLGWSGGNQDWDLTEDYQVAITPTLRMGFAMKDRWGIAVWLLANEGMEPRIRQIITAIHHNQLLRQAADALITGCASGKILTPLQFIRTEGPQIKGPDWFSASMPESDHQVAECGVAQTIVFGKCQRVQSVPDMD